MRGVLLLLVLLVFVGGASATDYYVNNSWAGASDSNSGLSDANTTAWLTIQKAANTVSAGDIVYVQSGTYNEEVIETTDGNAINRIVYQGMNSPVIHASGGTGFKIDADYVTVTGFEVENAYTGIYIWKANHTNVSYNTMGDFSCSRGVNIYGHSTSPTTPICGNAVEHNTINSSCHAIQLSYLINDSSVSYNVLNTSSNACGTLYFKYEPNNYTDFIGNTIRGGRNGFAGGSIYYGYIADNNIGQHYHNALNLHSTSYTLIENNTIEDSEGGDSQHAIFNVATTGPTSHDNIFKNNHVVAASTGNGVKLSNVENITFENLTVDDCGGEGMFIGANGLFASMASGNCSFRNITLHTTTITGVRFPSTDNGIIEGDYYFADTNITGANLLRCWKYHGTYSRPTSHIINANDVSTNWDATTGGEFRFYYPLDIQVVDTVGNPIDGATVTITNDVDGNYSSLNYNWENKTTYTTGANGHTPLPSDAENSAAIMDFRETFSGKTYMSHTVSVEKTGHGINSTTVNPSDSWYREDSDTYQNTTTIILSASGLYISDYYPAVVTGKNEGDSQFFNVTTNQTSNCTWYINGSQVQYNTSDITHNYTNTSLVAGGCNVTAIVDAGVETDSQTWLFNVASTFTWSPSVFGNYHNATTGYEIEVTVKGYGNKSHIFSRTPTQADLNATTSFRMVVTTA